MKNCQDIQPELSAYVDGELTPPQRAEIEAHVASCPRCQRELAELKTLAAGMAALPRLQPAPRFLAEVRRKIARGHGPELVSWQDHLFRPFWLKVPLEAAALIVVGMFVVRFVKPMPAGKAATLEMARTEKTNAGRGTALRHEPLVAQKRATKSEPANEPARVLTGPRPSTAAAPSIANPMRLPEGPIQSPGAQAAPEQEIGRAFSPAPETAGWARSLGIDPSKLHGVVTVGARDAGDIRNRAEQLAAKRQGRVIPAPQSKEATGLVFFVELPREYAAAFTSELLQNSGTNAEDRLLPDLRLTGGVQPPASTTTVLEIRVVPPAN